MAAFSGAAAFSDLTPPAARRTTPDREVPNREVPNREVIAELSARIRVIERMRGSRHRSVSTAPHREPGDGGDPAALSEPPSPALGPITPAQLFGGARGAAPAATPPIVSSPIWHPAWSFGDDETDALLSPLGTDDGSTYEIKPVAYAHGREARASGSAASLAGRRAAAQALALRIAVRRCAALAGSAASGDRTAPVLWCLSAAEAGEGGRLSGHGLARLGLDPARIVMATPARAADVLWAAEEAIRSESFALVVLQADDIALTPSRRLSLAAREHRTPCLLLTHPETPPAAAVLYRWRTAPACGAAHPFVPRAPGAYRLAVALERGRGLPARDDSVSEVLEWSDEARRFRLAAGVAARSLAAGGARRRAG